MSTIGMLAGPIAGKPGRLRLSVVSWGRAMEIGERGGDFLERP